MENPPTIPSSNRLLERMDDFTRQDPPKAMVAAFGLRFLLHLLPLGAIASMLFSLLFALARPIFLLLGVLKIFDFVRACRHVKRL